MIFQVQGPRTPKKAHEFPQLPKVEMFFPQFSVKICFLIWGGSVVVVVGKCGHFEQKNSTLVDNANRGAENARRKMGSLSA